MPSSSWSLWCELQERVARYRWLVVVVKDLNGHSLFGVVGEEPGRVLEITVLHYPPGTSKWNKIEHRLFSFISMNWRGRPLTSIRTIIDLISATTTQTRL